MLDKCKNLREDFKYQSFSLRNGLGVSTPGLSAQWGGKPAHSTVPVSWFRENEAELVEIIKRHIGNGLTTQAATPAQKFRARMALQAWMAERFTERLASGVSSGRRGGSTAGESAQDREGGAPACGDDESGEMGD